MTEITAAGKGENEHDKTNKHTLLVSENEHDKKNKYPGKKEV